uniref:Uncharacterized protein n=1 Tax=Candidatus Methanophaga sp. ANME-1 ERB7 TaxID=2759913 RepID=A0A7G9Z8D2_9EURY|nr:hypothetical protein CNIFIPMI_00008 [Methanosarcinales archaeon ANME-1 ERB7]
MVIPFSFINVSLNLKIVAFGSLLNRKRLLEKFGIAIVVLFVVSILSGLFAPSVMVVRPPPTLRAG